MVEPVFGNPVWGQARTLAKPKQGTPVTAAAGFIKAHEAPGAALCVTLLPFEVIDVFAKIEPDHGVVRAMSLRLSFIAKWSQWQSGSIGRDTCDDQRCRKIYRAFKQRSHRYHHRCFGEISPCSRVITSPML